MRIKQQLVEKLVRAVVAKPLAWTIYGCGVIMVRTARVIVVGTTWLMRRRKGATWAK